MMLKTAAWLALVLPLLLASVAAAQANDEGDVVFELRFEYYDADPLFGGRSNVVSYPPTTPGAYGSLSAPDREQGNINLNGLKTTRASASAAVDSLEYTLENASELIAQPTAGQIFGNGVSIYIDVWVEGETGTPYWVTETLEGALEVDMPRGAGRVEAVFDSQLLESVNGNGHAGPEPISRFRTYSGTSGVERIIGNKPYSHAGSYPHNLRSGVGQSITICGIFQPCPAEYYFGRGKVVGTIDAGVGERPPCTGRIKIVREGPRVYNSLFAPGQGFQLTDRHQVEAEFESGATGDLCKCCRFEQFLRIRRMTVVDAAGNEFSPTLWGRGQQTVGQTCMLDPRSIVYPSFEPDEYQEDSLCSQEPMHPCRNVALAYGDRESPAPCLTEQYTPSLRDGCRYDMIDSPGFPHIPLDSDKTYLVDIDFEARLVVDPTAECSNGERQVVARRRWTTCFEARGNPGGVPTIMPCGERQGRDLSVALLNVGGRAAALNGYVEGNLVVGTVAVESVPGELVAASQLGIDAPGALTAPAEDLFAGGSGLLALWTRPFIAEFPGPPPSRVEVLVTFNGETVPAVLEFKSGCYADCDGNGSLSIFDFLCFQDLFATGDPAADCDGSGSLDIFDFLCFQDAFATGCP